MGVASDTIGAGPGARGLNILGLDTLVGYKDKEYKDKENQRGLLS